MIFAMSSMEGYLENNFLKPFCRMSSNNEISMCFKKDLTCVNLEFFDNAISFNLNVEQYCRQQSKVGKLHDTVMFFNSVHSFFNKIHYENTVYSIHLNEFHFTLNWNKYHNFSVQSRLFVAKSDVLEWRKRSRFYRIVTPVICNNVILFRSIPHRYFEINK